MLNNDTSFRGCNTEVLTSFWNCGGGGSMVHGAYRGEDNEYLECQTDVYVLHFDISFIHMFIVI